MGLWDVLYALAVYLLATFTVCALTSPEDKLQMMQTKNATYCGSALADALSLVCRGKYNTPVANERERRSISSNNKRKKRYIITKGVYDECCRNACSYAVLKSYCWD